MVERDSYDAWGKRRFPTGADDPAGSLTSQTTRGFTGQEELPVLLTRFDTDHMRRRSSHAHVARNPRDRETLV